MRYKFMKLYFAIFFGMVAGIFLGNEYFGLSIVFSLLFLFVIWFVNVLESAPEEKGS